MEAMCFSHKWQTWGPARDFGYTVSRAILIRIQAYGIFGQNSGIKYYGFSWILGIRYIF